MPRFGFEEGKNLSAFLQRLGRPGRTVLLAAPGALFFVVFFVVPLASLFLLSLDKPTGVAFDADGNAYVAVFGTAAEGSDKPAGQILKVSGLK